jgi:hypothetical protein
VFSKTLENLRRGKAKTREHRAGSKVETKKWSKIYEVDIENQQSRELRNLATGRAEVRK